MERDGTCCCGGGKCTCCFTCCECCQDDMVMHAGTFTGQPGSTMKNSGTFLGRSLEPIGSFAFLPQLDHQLCYHVYLNSYDNYSSSWLVTFLLRLMIEKERCIPTLNSISADSLRDASVTVIIQADILSLVFVAFPLHAWHLNNFFINAF